jgi:hypothetical protein
MYMWVRIAWFLGGVAVNAATVFGVSTYLINAHMSGFNTSQSNLAGQMNEMSSSMNAFKAVVDKKTDDSKTDLVQAIATLDATIRSLSADFSKNLQENSAQLAALNGTMAGFDSRLSDTIARTERVEAIILKQHILYNPPNDPFEGKYAAEWAKAGVKVESLVQFNDAKAINDWIGFAKPKQ